VNNDNSSE